MTASIDEPALIHVRGADARAFLHAQLTCRVDDLAPGETRLGAWCNAQGRVRALFRLLGRDEDIYIRLPAALAARVMPKLGMFVLRSRVELALMPADTGEGATILRAYGPCEPLAEIAAGLPELYPETSESFIPQMLDLDRLGAVDFRKGCYPGQEIVARAQHRGQVKRRLFRMRCDQPAPPGTSIVAGADAVGTVVRAAPAAGTTLLLAVLQLDAAAGELRLESVNGSRLAGVEPVHPANAPGAGSG